MHSLAATPNFKAGGNIAPMTVVKMSTVADETVLAAGAAPAGTIGVSQRATRNPPGTASDDGFAAIAGENIQIHGIGEVAWVLTNGAITAGDHVKSDTNSQVITATTGNVCVGYALQAASGAGIQIRVLVNPHTM